MLGQSERTQQLQPHTRCTVLFQGPAMGGLILFCVTFSDELDELPLKV